MMEPTEKNKVVVLLLIVVLGFFLRLRGLDRVGFNEDEVNKVEAARAYRQGGFSVNLEHPMFMKSLVTLSLAAADSWNRTQERIHQISEEVAVRLPNVIFGSLTAVVIFLVAQEFFGFGVGLISALLWSIGIVAITVNRLAKEDTLLVFFTWLGYYFYIRAKKLGSAHTVRQERFYAASGASFGLMLASKYFPHYFGLNALYYHLLGRGDSNQPLRKRDYALFLGTCAVVFFVLDPIVLLPSALEYMVRYLREGTITHHGYLMMGHFYYDEPAHLGGGMPIYFYLLFIAIKTPLPILGALIVGLMETWKRRHEPGPFFLMLMFLFWIIPFSLLGSKWLRYMLSRMPTVYIISAIGMLKIFSFLSALVRQRFGPEWRPALVAAFVALFFLEPLWVTNRAAPFYSFYLNPLGMGRVGYYFPHDELDDAGLREAIRKICAEAPRGASVGGEAPAVFEYYLHKFSRDDLRYFRLSDAPERDKAPRSAYVVVQEGRKYFENISFIRALESDQQPAWTIQIRGGRAAQVYRVEELAQLRQPQ
jgi:4-amino-4-deoxy-L-arabinose transferase-like glycosyltransferase